MRISVTVRDLSGALVDPTTLTATVQRVNTDGTVTVTGTYSSPTRDSLGAYHQDIPVADLGQIGHYQGKWASTGTGAGEIPFEFDVYDPFEPAVLSLQDGKGHLKIPQADTTYDTAIASWIATIETSLEAMTGGPLINRSVTERAELTSDLMLLTLRQRPIVSVTSVTSVVNGSAVDISSGLDIDTLANTVQMKGGWAFPAFSTRVNAVYVAGWGTFVPAAFNVAARIILAHLWQTQHGPSARPSVGGQETAMAPGFAFAIPKRAAEMLNGSLNGLPFRCAGAVCA